MTTERRDDVTANAGSETDQHITGSEETGTFLTDQPPAPSPATGSSNVGINERRANREEGQDEDRQG